MENNFKLDDRAVDVNNDAMMVSLGLRDPVMKYRDPSIWTKTPEEKLLARKIRKYPIGVI